MEEDIGAIPPIGWTVKMDRSFPEKRVQRLRASFSQIIQMLPLTVRYLCYYVYSWFIKIIPVMDFLKVCQTTVKRGAPLGGIGSGTIGRSISGEFCNFQMVPGFYENSVVPADQFIVTIMTENRDIVYQKVLCVPEKQPSVLKSWDWQFPAEDGEYTALYPRSWYVYHIKEHDVKLICRQINPVIPDNYKDSSIPGAVFVWTVVNKSNSPLLVSLTFTFKNGVGSKSDKRGSVSSKYFDTKDPDCSVSGVSIEQKIGGVSGSYLIGCCKKDNSITRCPYFDPNGSGKTIWNDLRMHGELQGSETSASKSNEELAVAVCSQFNVPAGSKMSTEFCLLWNFPQAKFLIKDEIHMKYYTKHFGNSDTSGQEMMTYCFKSYPAWEKSMKEWQAPILDNLNLPNWYKSALFNELYYVSDGGTVWLLPFKDDKFEDSDPRSEFGHFGYLEGQEYRMYNTYDVHFYASFALSMLWPSIQAVIQYDMNNSINDEIKSSMWFLASGKCAERKKRGTVPHDLGNPGENPFILINSYPIHDVSEWRDLNLKFVLQVHRDYKLRNNLQYLKDTFPQIKTVMEKSLLFDEDNDGMIENSGSADQTYDCWKMTGTSAYCGSLWLGALYATVEIATILEESDVQKKFSDILDKAKEAFDHKLWNGKYYNFDCSKSENHSSIMSDQLCGLWYLKCLDPSVDILPESKVNSALLTIFENNVLKYFEGQQGAVNGMLSNGTVDTYSLQSEEMWTGVTYAFSSLLISHGYIKEGFKASEGVINTIYNKAQLAFASPESLHGSEEFRSLAYMRPLSIWSIQLALDTFNRNKSADNLDPKILNEED